MRHGDLAAVPHNKTVLREFVERGKLPCEALGARAVRAADVGQIDAQIAHQPFDDAAAQPVLRRHRASAHGCWPAGHDRVAIADHVRGVLHVSARQRADGGRAEADQVHSFVGRVALEIAVQSSFALALGKRIVGAREVIEPDVLIA